MRRTLEWVASICGTVMSLFLLLIGIGFSFLARHESYLNGLHSKWGADTSERLQLLMENVRMEWILPGLIGITFGTVFIICLKKGVKLIVVAWISIVVSGVLSFMSAYGSFPAFFFIIAGLIILVRKAASTDYNKYSSGG